MPKVKCADCGFLGLRKRDSRDIVDAEDGLRNKGIIPRDQLGTVYDDHPLCFTRSINMWELLGQFPDSECRLREVQRERDCHNFTPWRQGFTPKEHADRIESERMRLLQANEEFVRFRHNVVLTLLVAAIGFIGAIVGALLTMMQ